MREEFFSKIRWTRFFISGPADPLHNPFMVWCHICKKNFSIRTKGTMEILCHHRTETNLRKDQKWHYEHLGSVDLGSLMDVQRRTNALVLLESRAKSQLSIVGDFIQRQGDLSVLCNLWLGISSYTDRQATLCDFDCGEERYSR